MPVCNDLNADGEYVWKQWTTLDWKPARRVAFWDKLWDAHCLYARRNHESGPVASMKSLALL